MEYQFCVGLVVGFGFGAFLVAGIFYTLYLQISNEIFENISQIKKTMGWLGVRMRVIANEEDKG